MVCATLSVLRSVSFCELSFGKQSFLKVSEFEEYLWLLHGLSAAARDTQTSFFSHVHIYPKGTREKTVSYSTPD